MYDFWAETGRFSYMYRQGAPDCAVRNSHLYGSRAETAQNSHMYGEGAAGARVRGRVSTGRR
ncbi:hypothetical protein BH23ACT9_BH23ACT9_02050 [soil metagenome]